MECPKCHYVLTPFEAECPRCKNFAALGILPPSVTTPEQSEIALPSSADDQAQTPVTTTAEASSSKSWIAALDLEDKEPPGETGATPSASRPATDAVTPAPAVQPAYRPPPPSLRPPAASVAISPPLPSSPVMAQARVNDLPAYAPPLIMPRPAERPKSGNRIVFLLGGVTLIVVFALLGLLRSVIASHEQNAKANQALAQEGQLVQRANAAAALFQQVDLSPEQAAASIHSRTLEYQEVLQRSQMFPQTGTEQVKAGLQKAISDGLLHVQADTDAESARELTADVLESIRRDKGQSLTDKQAATIRAVLGTKCHAALADCAQALQIDPMNAVALSAQVQALRYLGEDAAADAALTHALTVCPNNPFLISQKGVRS